jgi:hypothetical protein
LPLPLVVIAKRGGPPPALTVRNMFTFVLEPKSNTRAHASIVLGFTQAEIVKSCRLLAIPVGSRT